MARKAVIVAGARPNFMKVAPVIDAMKQQDAFDPCLVNTGQHYDRELAEIFFRELGLPEPDVDLEVGSASHALQTARIMERFEPVLKRAGASVVVVVGDVNSTVACSLVAAKLGVAVAHVEAGLRSRDRTMPEELNRIVTDHLSDYLFATETAGVSNLRAEGIPEERIFLVGNVMIDTLRAHSEAAKKSQVLARLGIDAGDYAVLTLHRPSNVDGKGTLERLVGAFETVSRRLKIVWPVHPRTRARLESFGLSDRVESNREIISTPPLGYVDFLRLISDAAVVMTDSGGLQEETCVLGVPCVTLRENTERPVTVEAGGNVLVGNDAERVVAETLAAVRNGHTAQEIPLWDGQAAQRIVSILSERVGGEER